MYIKGWSLLDFQTYFAFKAWITDDLELEGRTATASHTNLLIHFRACFIIKSDCKLCCKFHEVWYTHKMNDRTLSCNSPLILFLHTCCFKKLGYPFIHQLAWMKMSIETEREGQIFAVVAWGFFNYLCAGYSVVRKISFTNRMWGESSQQCNLVSFNGAKCRNLPPVKLKGQGGSMSAM